MRASTFLELNARLSLNIIAFNPSASARSGWHRPALSQNNTSTSLTGKISQQTPHCAAIYSRNSQYITFLIGSYHRQHENCSYCFCCNTRHFVMMYSQTAYAPILSSGKMDQPMLLVVLLRSRQQRVLTRWVRFDGEHLWKSCKTTRPLRQLWREFPWGSGMWISRNVLIGLWNLAPQIHVISWRD